MRKHLAWQIIAATNKLNSFVFGGFVRDYLSGDDFNDIDIFFPGDAHTSQAIPIAVQQLLRQGMVCKLIADNPYHMLNMHRLSYTIFSSDGKTSVNVDFVQRVRGNSMSVPFCKGTDVDVNQLYMINSTIQLWSDYPSDWQTVSQHIQAREFSAESTVSFYRIQKMKDRGYRQVNMPKQFLLSNKLPIHNEKFNKLNYHIKNTPQLPAEVKCKQCQKNVTVDEPQCWWCGISMPGRK